MTIEEIKDNIIKFSKNFADKAEDYAKIAKLQIEIKKIEAEVIVQYKNLGKEVYAERENGKDTISLNEGSILEVNQKIAEMKSKIDGKKAEIEKIKAEADLKDEDIDKVMEETTKNNDEEK